VEEEGSKSWEDEVGEEFDVEDQQEELGGGQMEPLKSQVRVQWEGETQNLRGVCCWQGGF
jgi:hypothetical protein